MKKYCIAGASGRCYYMFAKTLSENYKDVASIEGIYDPNITRSKYFNTTIDKKIKVYENFDEMIDSVKPDAVIVTTTDAYHHEYAVRSLKKGCDVICEKPMTIDEVKSKEIINAERQSGKKVTVTFNCRFMPYFARIKELIMQNTIGKILNINYEYLLDRTHGADYFRRWHRKMENSGSLLVHKSTHHLDICNWLLADRPKTVSALGSLHFFGPNRKNFGERCSNCKHTKTCEFYVDFSQDCFSQDMYFKAEDIDGYKRDACPFAEEINIYDNMSLSVRYEKGTLLTYTLITYNQYEGYKINITGTEGRIEAEEIYVGEGSQNPNYVIRIIKNDGEVQNIIFSKSTGNHGGGDERLINMLFRGDVEDKLSQCASSLDGAISALIGICARKSIQTEQTIDISKYIKYLEE